MSWKIRKKRTELILMIYLFINPFERRKKNNIEFSNMIDS